MRMHTLTVYFVFTAISVGATFADEAAWKRTTFSNGVSVEVPLKMSQPDSEVETFVGIEMSPLPDPLFDVYALVIRPIEPGTPQSDVDELVRELSDLQISIPDISRDEFDVERQTSRDGRVLETSACSRFRPLPYDLYHVVKAEIIDGTIYVMAVASIIQCSNRIAISEFGQIPSKRQIQREKTSIRHNAQRFFKSLQRPSDSADPQQKQPS